MNLSTLHHCNSHLLPESIRPSLSRTEEPTNFLGSLQTRMHDLQQFCHIGALAKGALGPPLPRPFSRRNTTSEPPAVREILTGDCCNLQFYIRSFYKSLLLHLLTPRRGRPRYGPAPGRGSSIPKEFILVAGKDRRDTKHTLNTPETVKEDPLQWNFRKHYVYRFEFNITVLYFKREKLTFVERRVLLTIS